MTDKIKVRHTITGLVRDMSIKEFDAIAFTPLHKVFEVVDPDTDVDCTTCGSDEPEVEEAPDLGVVEESDEYDYPLYDKGEDK